MNRWKSLFAGLSAGLVLAASPAAADETVPPRAHPALWRVEHGANRLYLFGSLHILPNTLAWIDPEIAKAMEAANRFVFEVQIDDDALAAQKDFIVHHGLLPRGTALHRMLPASDFATYATILRRAGLNPVEFDRYRPWLASLVVGFAYVHKRDIADLHGADDALLDYAQSHGKDIGYLETIDEQMALLDRGDDASQVQALRDLLDALPQARAGDEQLVAAWSAGDSARVASIVDGYFRGHEEARGFLVGMRNDEWLPRIDTYLNSGQTTFLTVGAAHLGGDGGLIRELCARGDRVERVGSTDRPAAVCRPKP
jgi:uncharacterized protein YbaP (TraB family)